MSKKYRHRKEKVLSTVNREVFYDKFSRFNYQFEIRL